MEDLTTLLVSPLPVYVKSNRLRSVLGLALITVSIASAWWFFKQGRAVSATDLVLLALFGGTAIGLCLYELHYKGFLVRLDSQGVTFRGWNGCPVAWHHINGVWKHHVDTPEPDGMLPGRGVDYVCIAMKDSGAWRRRQGFWRRLFRPAYRPQAYGDMYVCMSETNVSAERIVAAIQSQIG